MGPQHPHHQQQGPDSDGYRGQDQVGRATEPARSRGQIDRFKDHPDYAYAFGNLTKAYPSTDVTNATRQFVYLKDAFYLIYDRVGTPSPSAPKEWLLHMIDKPTVNGTLTLREGTTTSGILESANSGLVTISRGASKLFSKTLLPSSPGIRLIGGGPLDETGYHAYVEGTRYRCVRDDAGTVCRTSDFDAQEAGYWRAEVYPTIASADTVFLHVLEPTADRAASMTPTSRIQGTALGGSVAAQAAVIDGAQKWVVIFNGVERRTTDYTYAVTLSGPVKHLLTDLEAGRYDAKQEGVTIATFEVGPDGTGFFTSSGGGHFTLGAATADRQPPTVTIGSPTSNPTATTQAVPLNLAGSASDNIGVVQVAWSSDRGGSGTASGTTNWIATGIPLQAGQNVITVTARDAAGNSPTLPSSSQAGRS